MNQPKEALVSALRAELGDAGLRAGVDVSSRHDCDWTGLQPHHPELVLLPADTAQVSRALALCCAAGQPVVVQGGLTGLAGGATPQSGEVVLSLERLNGIESLDPAGMTMTVLAGTPLQALHGAADKAGLLFPLDLGARGSCQIGGNVATNAGGNNVIRYGMARAQVLGLEAVLADGTVISAMNDLLKNNAGMDLKQLFIGSEGQLGVVTRMVLRLYPRPGGVATALCAVPSPDAAVELLGLARQTFAETLTSFEVMWESYIRLILKTFDRLREPFDESYPAYVLMEVRGSSDSADQAQMASLLERAFEQDLVRDAVVAGSLQQAQQLWAIRDSAGELIPTMGRAAVFDIGVPIAAMCEFVEALERTVDRETPRPDSVSFGHIGDGNLHFMVACADDAQRARIEQAVYTETGRYHGSVSAEHGIGMHKKPYLGESRSAAEIALMKRLKTALDPAGILNPGRMIG